MMMDGSMQSLESSLPSRSSIDGGDPLASVEPDKNNYNNHDEYNGGGNTTNNSTNYRIKLASAKNRLLQLKGSKMTDVQFPLVLIAVSSIVLLIAITTWEGDVAKYGYAVSIPSVSFSLSMTGFFGAQYREELYERYGKYLTHVLFLWNLSGASFLTFSEPFMTTGNGYFAAWTVVAASSMAMGITADAFKDKIKGLGSLMGAVASSVILILSLMEYVTKDASSVTRGAALYAMVLSCFTIAGVFGIMALKKRGFDGAKYDYNKFIALTVFAFLWLVCACHVTFHGPFVTTGNGYFSAWAGCGCLVFAASNAKKEIDGTSEEIIEEIIEENMNDTGLSDDI